MHMLLIVVWCVHIIMYRLHYFISFVKNHFTEFNFRHTELYTSIVYLPINAPQNINALDVIFMSPLVMC